MEVIKITNNHNSLEYQQLLLRTYNARIAQHSNLTFQFSCHKQKPYKLLKALFRRSFESNVIIHEPLERALVPGLSQVYGIDPRLKQADLYVNMVQPIQPVNAMPRD